MQNIPKTIDELINKLSLAETVWVGFSGGGDSLALLHVLLSYKSLNIKAIHVNHQLQDESNDWASYCQQICDQWQVPLVIAKVIIDKPFVNGLEADARKKRYEVFVNHIGKNDVLLLAHHLNDQVETFLQRLVKGQGFFGLSGILKQRLYQGLLIIRPFIDIEKKVILSYLEKHQLKPIDDKSNLDNSFERNWLRNEVMPLIQMRYTSFLSNIKQLQLKVREAKELNRQLAQIDLSFCAVEKNLILEKFLQLNHLRQINCLQYWLKQKVAINPDRRQILVFLAQIKKYSKDKQPECRWRGYVLKAYDKQLFFYKNALSVLVEKEQKIIFDANFVCILNDCYKLTAKKQSGPGLRFIGDLSWAPYNYKTEKIKIAHRLKAGSKLIKTLLHEHKVPPWYRQSYPLVLFDSNIAYVPNIGCNSAASLYVAEDGWVIELEFINS